MTPHVAIRCKEGLPKKRDEPWFLMTNLGRPAAELTNLPDKRMTVEELFRNGKSQRNGYAPRQARLTRPERIDRLLLVLALA